MKNDNNNELFPVVDTEGCVVASATRGECHNGSMLLHPVVHLHVFDTNGRLYLQKRPLWKDIQPGKWDTAVGGHVDYGEEIMQALRREAREELGLESFSPHIVKRYVFESDRERELVHTFLAIIAGTQLSPSDELDGGAWWTGAELTQKSALLTPNLKAELSLVLKAYHKIIGTRTNHHAAHPDFLT